MQRITRMLRIIRQRTGWDGGTLLTVALLLAVLYVALGMPMLYVLRHALWSDGQFTLQFITDAFADPNVSEVLINSLWLATVTTLATALLTLPLALINARTQWRGQALMAALLLVPMILPPFVGAIGMRQLLAPYGVLNALLQFFGLVGADFHRNWFVEHRFAGVVLLQTLHLYPIMYLNLVAALANVDPSLEEAGRNMGASGFGLFRRITFPLMLPGFFAGAILVFIWALTDLGTPLMFNYDAVVAVKIFRESSRAGSGSLNALVLILLLLVIILYYLARVTFGGRSHEMMARSVHVGGERNLGRWATVACWAFFGLVFAMAALPHAMVILTSLGDTWSGTVLPERLTFSYHIEALDHRLTMPSIRNSLFYALVATAVCAVASIFIARLLVRKKFLGRNLVDTLVMLPLAIPGVVLAFGYLYCYYDWGQWLVERGIWRANYLYPERFPVIVLIIAYTIRRLPYMVRSAVAGMQQTSRTLEEASQNLGASPLVTLWRVTVPLVMANLIAGGILVFTFSMLEVSDSLMLAREARYYPLTKAIYEIVMGEYALTNQAIASALGVWAMILLAVALLITSKILGKKMGAIFRV